MPTFDTALAENPLRGVKHIHRLPKHTEWNLDGTSYGFVSDLRAIYQPLTELCGVFMTNCDVGNVPN